MGRAREVLGVLCFPLCSESGSWQQGVGGLCKKHMCSSVSARKEGGRAPCNIKKWGPMIHTVEGVSKYHALLRKAWVIGDTCACPCVASVRKGATRVGSCPMIWRSAPAPCQMG